MRIIKFLLAMLASIAVAGCGSGSGNSTPPPSAVVISGTAAAGAPIVGYVSVRDSSANTQPVKANIPIEANGKYTVDVTGLTPPFAFLADGTIGGNRVTLYSAATSDDAGKTINITPFTDLIIRNIAATAVDNYLNTSGNMAKLTTAELNAKRVALTTLLAPALTAMGVDSSIDLLRATFNADHSGLDRFMDAVKVDTTTPTAVTITNIMDAANKLTINTTASATTIATTGTLGTVGMTLPGTASPLDLIVQGFDKMSALYATSLPNVNDSALLALFSSTFKDDGMSFSAFFTSNLSSPEMIGMKFINVGVDLINTTTGFAKVHFTPVKADGTKLNPTTAGGAMFWQFKRDINGVWQSNGNQRIAFVKVNSYALKGVCNPLSTTCAITSGPTYQTGLSLNVENTATSGIGSAVVTGPGLPTGGVTLTAQVNATWFKITTANSNICTGYVLCNGNYWIMNDTEIALVTANSVYTVALWSNATTPVLLATYTQTLPAVPVLNTATAAMNYPSLSGMVNLTGTGATTTPISWSKPAELVGGWINTNVWQVATPSNNYANAQQDSIAASGTASLALIAPTTGTWTGGNYSITAFDQYARRVQTFYP